MSHLLNIYRNEKTLSYQPLTNLAIPNSIDLTQESELDQTSNVKNPIDILASYPFPEIELEQEYDPELPLGN